MSLIEEVSRSGQMWKAISMYSAPFAVLPTAWYCFPASQVASASDLRVASS